MADYYVNNDGGNNENPGSEGEPWGTLAYADDQLSPGDTLYIMEGTGVYSEQLRPGDSGTSGNYITFENYPGDSPRIYVSQGYCVNLLNRDYIKIVGLTIGDTSQSSTSPLKGVHIRNSNYIEIRDCTIQYGRNDTYARGIADDWAAEAGACTYITIAGNTIHDWGVPGGVEDDEGECIKIHDYSEYVLIENNVCYAAGHVALTAFSDYTVVRGNTVYNTSRNKCASFYGGWVNGYYKLVEDNDFYDGDEYEGTYPNGSLQLGNKQLIFRKNRVWNGIGTGIEFYHQTNYHSTDSRCYNNTTYQNGQGEGASNTGYASHLEQSLADPDCTGIVWKNNIFYDDYREGVGYRNLAESGDHTETQNWETSDGDPQFNDPANGDFTLNQFSQCIDNGAWLTTTNGAGEESTTLIVDDSYYFCDGYGIVTGDTIQLEGQETTAVVTNVDYSTHTLTIDTALTWSDGDGVALEYSGDAPDQGAEEYTGSTPTGEGTQAGDCIGFGTNF